MANRHPKNDSPVRFSAAVLPLTAVCRGHLISLICFIHDAMRRPTWIVCKRAGAQGVSVPGCPIPLTSSAAPRAASLAPWLAASVAWLAALSAASLAVSSAASLAAWSAASGRLGCLVGRLVGCLVGYLVGCLVGCLVGRLVGPPRRVPRPLEPPSSMLAQQMGSAMVPPRRHAENCMDWTPPAETPSNPPPHSCCDAPSSAGLLNANTKEGGRGGVRAIARRMRCAVPATVTIDR